MGRFVGQPPPEMAVVTATVLEINRGEAEGRRSGGTVTLVTARLRLEDGTQARVLIQGAEPEVGDTVSLIESRHADGSRRYRLETPSLY